MAFSDRGSLLQAPPNLYKVLLAATSGLCSGRHSYVLLFAPYLRIQRSPLAVVLTLWLRKLADEASNYPEACSLVYQRVLELRKKVAEIRLNQPPHGPHDSTCEATRLKMKTTFHHQIGFSAVLQERSQVPFHHLKH
ncbi:hypothetical protein JHK82_024403 [Glycine max]|nr:hypothetical protein JHK85_024990 [Glycine max]KAG5012237.1 hypothetical protein JHK86_024498 [Glycine max]KAG5133215.1 hypothetical protein JHK82_024403 [Glycine max]